MFSLYLSKYTGWCKSSCLGLLLLASGGTQVWAETKQASELSISRLDGTATLHILARQVLFPQLLAGLANDARLHLHYAGLAAQRQVSGDCIGLLSEVLQCLLGGNINTVVRYGQQGNAEEAWIMGTQTDVGFGEIKAADGTDEIAEEEPDLLAQAVSNDAAQRLFAITQINANNVRDKTLAKKVLSDALADNDPQVRSTAIRSLVGLQGAAAKPELLNMLTDRDVTVRLAAVTISNDTEVLQQAQSDSNQQVRDMAMDQLNRLHKNR